MNSTETRIFKQAYAQFQRLLKLHGYTDATISSYSHAIRRLADWRDRCPHKRLTKNDFEAYFSALISTHSWATIKCDRNGIMRFWECVLECEWPWVNLIKPPVQKKLPDILTQTEITELLNHIEEPRFRVYLFTVYTLGLRLSEGLHLKPGDIDGKILKVHIRNGKGHKDRFINLPQNTYQLLRQYWATHRNPDWVFPSRDQTRYPGPMDRGGAQHATGYDRCAAHPHTRIGFSSAYSFYYSSGWFN